MESGESSSTKRKRGGPSAAARQQEARERLPLKLATLKAVKEKAERRVNKMSLGVTVQYFDNTDAPYDWLLPGWIVEERFVPSSYRGRGRIYKMMMMMMMMVQYYYDPIGHSYHTKRQDLFAWEELNIICHDT
ncbi:hypothetical protein J1N35_033440 [Gossypium stocksii]|uniref:Uncharacterized protein n=1 Tax=Gossypium stocksii TaxID=47602 RepID=A0A9D3ZPL5_9ROSI|nr:hypothetical protein J1N35_033440 [Gossypium stocksii]